MDRHNITEEEWPSRYEYLLVDGNQESEKLEGFVNTIYNEDDYTNAYNLITSNNE